MDTDSDLEGIDLESTEVSDQDAEKEYDVEKILASKHVNGEDRYLVLWKGYPIERSTWEPERSFTDPNTVLDWRRAATRQKKGLEEAFDWQEWDRQRQENELKTAERRRKREIKRQRLGWVRRDTYDSGPELEGFVVSDNEISSEHGSGSSSESEPNPLERVRKRKKGSASIESDDASDDSLMEAARRKHLRRQKRLKAKRRSGYASQEESLPSSPKTRPAEKREDQVRLEKRKRVGSPAEILSGAARNLSLESNQQGRKQQNGADRQLKKQKLQGPIKIVAKPLRPGPSRLKQRRASDNLVAPGQIKTFTSLSHVNRIYKAGKNEPPPDPSQLQLFTPGQPGRVLPPVIPLPRRASILHTNSESAGPSLERPPSPVKVNKSIPYANFRIPKRKPTTPAQGAQQPLPASTHYDDNQRYFGSETAYRRDSNTAREVTHDNRGPPDYHDAMDFDGGIDGMPQMVAPRHLMEVDNFKPSDPRVFVCNLEQGPQATLVGEAKLIGFPTNFVVELYNKPHCRALWISKFYGQNYLKEYFAPHYGTPLHNAAIEIDPDEVQPLINALAFLKGAGVVLHADFTMLVFLPSNHDLDKLAFKLPQLPAAGPNKIKPALRVVVYPPLEGIPIPSRNSNPEAHSLEITQVVDTLPWWENNLQYSLPAYLSNTIDCNWDELLGENIDKTKGKEIKETWYVLVYPPVAEAESEEFKHALDCLNRKVVDLNYLRNYLQQGHGHGLHTFTFLIHKSLRRQLHLLPDLVRDGKKEARSYWFYGTKIEHQVIDERPQRIWQSGTIIFVTPQLIVSCLEALKEFLYYADRKAATTKLALPSVWEEKVMEVMQNEPDQAVLNHVFDIKERIERNSIILIPVDIHLGCDELDIYIDEFALYQLDNPFQFRRYWFGHLTLPDPGILELFKSIEFYTFELFKTQRNEEYKRTQRDQELRKSQANPSPSNAATIRRDLPQGPERRP